MKNYLKRFLISLGILALCFSNVAYAHSGRTDSNGGHKDNKNKSGLGSYHYHCGGYPAHLHPNGVCPYISTPNTNKNSNSNSSSYNSSSSSSSSNNTQIPTSTTINAESIKINENIIELNIEDSKQLTTNILPTNTNDKKVTWKSSDESIIIVSETGKITALKSGKAKITVTTINGKTDSIEINVPEKVNDNDNIIVNTLSSRGNVTNTLNDTTDKSNPVAGIVTLGAIGGGSYWTYKKIKHKNKE